MRTSILTTTWSSEMATLHPAPARPLPLQIPLSRWGLTTSLLSPASQGLAFTVSELASLVCSFYFFSPLSHFLTLNISPSFFSRSLSLSFSSSSLPLSLSPSVYPFLLTSSSGKSGHFLYLPVVFNQGWFSPSPQKHLAAGEWVSATDTYWGDPTVPRTAPMTKNYPAPNANSAEAEDP